MIDVALLTLREMVRRRFILVAIAGTVLLIALTGWGFDRLAHGHNRSGHPLTLLQVRTISASFVILITYMYSFVLAMAAVFLGAPSLANDIETGILLPVATRPISRFAIISGKALALGLLVCGYAAVTGAIEFAVVHAVVDYVPPHPWSALGFLCGLALVMVALALLLSTRMSSIAASLVGAVLFGLAWIGGITGSIGIFAKNQALENAGTITQLILPTDAMWQSAAYKLEPVAMIASFQQAVARGAYTGPFFVAAPPPLAMDLWTAGWIAVIFALAAWSFSRRDL
ncbi:MAG: ABC transporter permease subunit [Candidatus Eremiobacteraeota bacterium]|nr:ABC transporter permease subunit [Candidatus Eremiobacteraeota bacterium]